MGGKKRKLMTTAIENRKRSDSEEKEEKKHQASPWRVKKAQKKVFVIMKGLRRWKGEKRGRRRETQLQDTSVQKKKKKRRVARKGGGTLSRIRLGGKFSHEEEVEETGSLPKGRSQKREGGKRTSKPSKESGYTLLRSPPKGGGKRVKRVITTSNRGKEGEKAFSVPREGGYHLGSFWREGRGGGE